MNRYYERDVPNIIKRKTVVNENKDQEVTGQDTAGTSARVNEGLDSEVTLEASTETFDNLDVDFPCDKCDVVTKPKPDLLKHVCINGPNPVMRNSLEVLSQMAPNVLVASKLKAC